MTLEERKTALVSRQAELDALRAGRDDIGREDPRLGRALGAVAAGQKAHLVYEFLKDYLTGRQQQLDGELFEAPEEEWDSIVRTKREVHRLVSNLTQLIKEGEGSARVLQPMMELQSE